MDGVRVSELFGLGMVLGWELEFGVVLRCGVGVGTGFRVGPFPREGGKGLG